LARKRIYEIAKELGITSKELIAKLADMGMPGLKAANTVDEEEYALIVHLAQEEAAPPEPEKPPKPVRKGIPRPPVVSVLGHIDHGKTTLLDAIRHSHVVSKEAGGITQSIGAYQADLYGHKITFIDTPGHKAFTGMRARGAEATDIAILVVAGDDGIMAQTVEAIDHIRAAGIPLIVAINKIDKPNADVEKVLSGLTTHGLTPEAYGGHTITVPISALNVEKIEDLSLREKDWIVAGSTCGRVKALIDGSGKRVREAGPGQAVEILGLQEVSSVGTLIEVKQSPNEAKRCAEEKRAKEVTPRRSRALLSVEDLFREATEEAKLAIILKATSTGALEAARRELEAIEVGDVELEFLHAGVGTVSESDILLASSVSGLCFVVGFGVKADGKASKLAEREGVIVLSYDIIYDLVDAIERALKRMISPEYEEIEVGEAEVRELFKIPTGMVAGCYVSEGKVTRNGKVRVLRGDIELFTGEIASLRRFENDVREVQAGRECGIRIKDFDDVEIGDQLIIFTLEEVLR